MQQRIPRTTGTVEPVNVVTGSVVAFLSLALSACQSSPPAQKSELASARLEMAAKLEAAPGQKSERARADFPAAQERASATKLSSADRAKLGSTLADNVRKVPAPAASPENVEKAGEKDEPEAKSGARALVQEVAPSRAVTGAEAERFKRLKTAIERANAEIERNRPSSSTTTAELP